MSDSLSARKTHLGTRNTGITTEDILYTSLCKVLNKREWEVQKQPLELIHIFDGEYGLKPDASIRNLRTGKVMYFEAKYQGNQGDADERAGKLFTHHFVDWLKTITGMDYHAYRLIFTG